MTTNSLTQLRGNSQQPNSLSPLRGERWFEVEVRIPGQRPLRELVKATSKREAFEITYRRYNTAIDPDGHLVQRIGQAQVAVVDAAQRRLSPTAIKAKQPSDASRRPIGRRRAAAPATTKPRLEGKTAFGNLQTGF